MKIFLGEMRRYLKPFPLIICGVLVLFWCLLYGHDSAFGDELNRQSYLLSVEYHQRFGDTIDRTELQEIKRDYAAATAELEQHSEDGNDQAFAELYYRHMEIGDVIGYFDILDGEIADMENGVGIFDDEVSETARSAKIADLRQGEASLINAVYGADIFLGDRYLNWETLTYLLCAVILLGALVKTNVSNINHLRFVTKHGRAIIKEELSAALALTVVINAAVNGLFFLFFACINPSFLHLMNCRMRTGAIGYVHLDVTFFQLILLYFAKQFLLSLLFTCVCFLIGCVSQNYIAALAPATVVLIALLVWSYRLNYRGDQLYRYGTPIPWIEWLPFVLVLAALVVLFRRVRKIELY